MSKPSFGRGRPAHMLLVAVIISSSGLLSACGRVQQAQPQAEEITINLATKSDQLAVGPTRLAFTLTDEEGQPITKATVNIEGNMTHAGMVPVLAQAAETQPGRYEALFEWTMGGDWIVTVDVSLPDGRNFTRQFPVSIR